MTAKAIAHVEQFAVVVFDSDSSTVIVTSGTQGPPGKDAAQVSAEPDNQIENKPDGLYVQPKSWSTLEW